MYAGVLAEGELTEARCAALRSLGAPVARFDYRPFYDARARDAVRLVLRKLGAEFRMSDLNAAFVRACVEAAPDVVFVDKGTEIEAESLRAVRRALGERGRRVLLFHFHPDDAFHPSLYTRTYGEALAEYDCHFIPHPWVAEQHRARGAAQVVDFPYGFDPSRHFRDPSPAPEFRSDVVFVGRWEPERGGWMSRLARAGFVVQVWGPGWRRERRRGGPNLVHRSPYADFREQRRAYAAAHVSLGLLSNTNRDGHTSRTFEVPACGGFMLAERTTGQCAFFREGTEIACFRGCDELLEKVRYYVEHEEERERIREAGYLRCTTSGYDYPNRMRRVVEQAERLLRCA